MYTVVGLAVIVGIAGVQRTFQRQPIAGEITFSDSAAPSRQAAGLSEPGNSIGSIEKVAKAHIVPLKKRMAQAVARGQEPDVNLAHVRAELEGRQLQIQTILKQTYPIQTTDVAIETSTLHQDGQCWIFDAAINDVSSVLRFRASLSFVIDFQQKPERLIQVDFVVRQGERAFFPGTTAVAQGPEAGRQYMIYDFGEWELTDKFSIFVMRIPKTAGEEVLLRALNNETLTWDSVSVSPLVRRLTFKEKGTKNIVRPKSFRHDPKIRYSTFCPWEKTE